MARKFSRGAWTISSLPLLGADAWRPLFSIKTARPDLCGRVSGPRDILIKLGRTLATSRSRACLQVCPRLNDCPQDAVFRAGTRGGGRNCLGRLATGSCASNIYFILSKKNWNFSEIGQGEGVAGRKPTRSNWGSLLPPRRAYRRSSIFSSPGSCASKRANEQTTQFVSTRKPPRV